MHVKSPNGEQYSIGQQFKDGLDLLVNKGIATMKLSSKYIHEMDQPTVEAYDFCHKEKDGYHK